MLRFYTLDDTYLGLKKFHLAIHLTIQVLLYLFNVQLHTPLILHTFSSIYETKWECKCVNKIILQL